MTRTRYRVLGNDAPYFLTMTINNWLPVFTHPETVAVLFICSRSSSFVTQVSEAPLPETREAAKPSRRHA